MKIAMVVEAKMLPVPDDITVVDNWGFVGVVDDTGSPLAHGEHMYLEGEEHAFCKWLSEYDAVWRTKPGTSPMFQQFEAVHIDQEG